MDQTLGRFGDRRLEKGGSAFWGGCWEDARFGFAGLVEADRGKSSLHAFYAILV